MAYALVIGSKNVSSWSLRPWLALVEAGIPFREVSIPLRRPETKAEILRHSPAGHVPILIWERQGRRQPIWDSLAILEFLAESHADAGLWPSEREARAHARAICAEMHAGFRYLREHCPMDLLARTPMASLPETVAQNVRRVVELWTLSRRRFGGAGEFLFGAFSAADAMYAPVASRFRTYLPDLAPYGDDGAAQAYVEAIFALPGMAKWEEGARVERAGEA
ncbi:MAG TPA: glutathione S-transferase family protein [Hyphomicrobiaceae bacterium]|jgi:glutathione S-transferase|nr:glutathione S-transferase family protein [Hyphomicrobiaceae bacterium]